MDVTVFPYPPGDPVLIDKIVNEFLSQGKFDKLRKECMADADTKPAYQNLQQRVESTVSQFLRKQVWKPDLNKNQLRDCLRKHILESGFLDAGINRIVDQIVNPNVLATVFMPEVEEVVYSYLSIPRPTDKTQRQNDVSVNLLPDVKSDEMLVEGIKTTAAVSDKEQCKRNQTGEEGSVNVSAEKIKIEDTSDKGNNKVSCQNSPSVLEGSQNRLNEYQKENEVEIKTELDQLTTDYDGSNSAKDDTKLEAKESVLADGSECSNKFLVEKMEPPSDESQESLSRMGVERLRISESDGINAPDSDASLPLEINEKSLSDSRDSDDSIMNKMSPISQGRLTPDDMSTLDDEKEGKKPLTFIGRIPKIKRDDSESSKSSKKEETPKRERLDVKSIYSSDESDSSKQSFCKSDSDDKKAKEKKRDSEKEKLRSSEKSDKNDKKYDGEEKRRKSDHHKFSSSGNRNHSKDAKDREEKSRSRRDEKDKTHLSSRDSKRDRSRDKNSSSNDKRSSSSSHSRSKSSSHHKNVHKSGSHDKEHNRDDSKCRDKDRSRHDRKEKDKRDFDKRKKDEEKRKKSRSVDDHSKERNKRDDRRSTDRDSNERERDKTKDSTSSRPQSDSRKKEKEHKAEDDKKEKNQREETDKKEDKCVMYESDDDNSVGNSSSSYKATEVYVNGLDKSNPMDNKYTADDCSQGNADVDDLIVEFEISIGNASNEMEVKSIVEESSEIVDVSEAKNNKEGIATDDDTLDIENNVRNEIEISGDFRSRSDKNLITDDSCDGNATKENIEASHVLDYEALHKEGVLTKVLFPKVIDDFYVKFDSTGFRYFENWETTKLDCEEEFKDYIDEAEKDLSLLSDDGSDYENHGDHFISEQNRHEIIMNSVKGLGNFENSLMFNPGTYDFYRWTNSRFYKRYRKNNSLSKNMQSKIAWPKPKTDPIGEYGGSGIRNFSIGPGEVRSIVANPREYNTFKANSLTDEDEMHGMAEKNKENHDRDKKMRKNFRLLNRYRRKIGLTFKHGKEQHKFVCRHKKKRFMEKQDEKSIKEIDYTVNEQLRGCINQTERLDGSGGKGKTTQGSHDLREWNSIGNISTGNDKCRRVTECLRLETGSIADIRNQENFRNINPSFKSKFGLHPSESPRKMKCKFAPRRLVGKNEPNAGFESPCDRIGDGGKKNLSVLGFAHSNGYTTHEWNVKHYDSVIMVEASDADEMDGENFEVLSSGRENFETDPQIVELEENCYVKLPDKKNVIVTASSTEENASNCEINGADEADVPNEDEITVEERLIYETHGKWQIVAEESWKTGRQLFDVEKLQDSCIDDVDVEEATATDERSSIADANSIGSEELSVIDDCSNDSYSKSSADASSEMNGSRLTPKMDVEAKIRLYQIQSMRRSKSCADSQRTCILARISSTRKTGSEEEEENEENEYSMVGNVDVMPPAADHNDIDGVIKKTKKRGIRLGLQKPKPKTENIENKRNDVPRNELKKKFHHNFIMPLSPESDDSSVNSNDVMLPRKDAKSHRKRMSNGYSDSIGNDTPPKKLKDCKRTVNQKYESQDLYKPRPFSVGSKTRGRSFREKRRDSKRT